MDFQSDDQLNGQYRPPARPEDVMQTASLVLSVIAVATICCLYASIVCGSLSIILALLARGQQKKLTPQGRLTVLASTAAIVIAVIVTIIMFLITIHEYGSLDNFIKAYTEMTQSMMGATILE